MSHKATSWLSTLPADSLGNAEFRILFHLCDCHNPAQGCFPTQAYLIAACAVSNGTLNAALKTLEAKGYITRHRELDGRTKRQKPTRYVLGFETKRGRQPAPETGDGSNGTAPSPEAGDGFAGRSANDPAPETGDGTRRRRPTASAAKPSPIRRSRAVSSPTPEPSPVSSRSRLQPTGEVTCKEPVINPPRSRLQPTGEVTCKEPVINPGSPNSARFRAAFFTADERAEAGEVAAHLRAGFAVRVAAVPARVRACLLAERMITEDEAQGLGLGS